MTTSLHSRMKISRWVWAIISLGGCVVLFLWQPFRQLCWQVALAALLTAACLPLQRKLETKMSRSLAALFSVVSVVVIIIGLLVMAIPQLIERISGLIAQVPQLLGTVQAMWDKISRTEWFQAMHLNADLPGTWMKEIGTWIAAEAPKLIGGMASRINTLSRAFLAPVLSYYLLRDRETFSYKASLWIPSAKRKTVLKALREMKREAGSFLRGQLMISLSVMILTALGLLILQIPSWLSLGLVMGICELIPYIGPFIGGVPILLFSLPLGMTRTLWALAMVIAVQQIEGYFLSPRLMAGAVSLHPVYVLLLLSAGGLIGGLIGMMAAIPLFVCARGALRVIYAEKQPETIVKIVNFNKE